MDAQTMFVIMPFGVRTLPTGASHDFDGFYRGVLRPIAQTIGWEVVRVDELVEPGTINDQAFRHLHAADLVVADISAQNSNVYYELGVRHAISPGETILVAVRGTELPFDLANQRVLFYDVDFEHDEAFRTTYLTALKRGVENRRNPVRAALASLGITSDPSVDRVAFEREFTLKIDRSRNVEQLVAVWHWVRQFGEPPLGGLLSLSSRLAEAGDFSHAVRVLDAAFPAADNDYEVHRQRGFYLRKLGQLEDAEKAFERARALNPSDPETLGMLAGALKRQGRYSDALERYREGARLSPTSLYLAVAHAGMSIIAAPDDPTPGRQLFAELLDSVRNSGRLDGDAWANLVCAEASFVLGQFDNAKMYARSAVAYGAARLDLESAAEQIRMLGTAGQQPEDADSFADWLLSGADDSIAHRVTARIGTNSALAQPQGIIFHLSDVHFGSIERGDVVLDAHRFSDNENMRRLSLELTDEFKRKLDNSKCGPDEATVVLSGDLTYTGRRKEFDLVHEFLDELCGNIGIKPAQVVIVPGNHDIDWQQTQSDYANRFDNYLSFASQFYGEELFRELFPLVSWDFKTTGKRPQANELVYFRSDPVVTFVGLNSCVFEDNQNHYGFVGKRQLDNVDKLLREAEAPKVRIAVMHHHLHPFPEPLETRKGGDVLVDLSTVRDAGMVEQRLEQLSFSLLLHGHKHKPQLRETIVRDIFSDLPASARPLIVSGCGSTGVSHHELEHSQPNHFAIIEILRPTREEGVDFVRVEWRELSLAPGADWATRRRWTIKG